MKRDSCFYMANLGSEMKRLYASREKGDKKEMETSYDRAMNIIEKALTLKELRGREGEFLMLKNLLQDLVSKKSEVYIQERHLASYFTPFALRVMSRMVS